MWYVQKDGNGVIVGVYRNPQPQPDGSVLTDPQPVTEDDPDVAAFFVKLKGPDVAGFVADVKAAVGGIVQANALAKMYPLFYPTIETANWPDLQALIVDARKTGVLNDDAYAAFKASAAARAIPVMLP